jgi:hypothetical protein
MSGADQHTEKHELFCAIEDLIATADPDEREALGTAIEAYARDFPEDFYWAVGGAAPTLLHQLISAIGAGCRFSRSLLQAVRLVDRKPAANALVQRDRLRDIAPAVRTTAPSQVRSVYGLPELW